MGGAQPSMVTVIGNLKGGAGKSTVAFNLALWLLHQGRTVTAFDLDPQQTLTDVAEVRAEVGASPRIPLQSGGVELLPALAGSAGEVVVDVGTADIQALKGAVAVADRVLVPVPPSQADIWSTQRFLALVREAAAPASPALHLFINRADTHHAIRESDEAAQALAQLDGIQLMSQRLSQRTAFRRSFTEGMAVFEMVPWSKASKEFSALAEALYPHTAISPG